MYSRDEINVNVAMLHEICIVVGQVYFVISQHISGSSRYIKQKQNFISIIHLLSVILDIQTMCGILFYTYFGRHENKSMFSTPTHPPNRGIIFSFRNV